MTDPIDTVTTFLTTMEAMDLDRGLAMLSPDAEYTNIPLLTVRGPDAARAVLEPFFAPIDANEFVILRRAAMGHVVFLERLDRHLVNGEWRELPVNSVFEVADDRITVWRDYFDATAAARIHAGVTA